MYKVKEIFYTLQGEGTHLRRPAVFVDFQVVIFGQEENKTGQKPFVNFAIRILEVQMGQMAELHY